MAPRGKDQDRMAMMVGWGLWGEQAVIIDRQFLGCCLAEEPEKFV
jgi:hypothetical protein